MAIRGPVKKKPRRPPRVTRKKCFFCSHPGSGIDYKDIETLTNFTTEHGKILSRRITGTCARHQRRLGLAVKRARYIALMPFVGD
jgi:small subunit ribosomal protein S18